MSHVKYVSEFIVVSGVFDLPLAIVCGAVSGSQYMGIAASVQFTSRVISTANERWTFHHLSIKVAGNAGPMSKANAF